MIGQGRLAASRIAIGTYQVSISPSSTGRVGSPGSLTSGNVTCNVSNGVEPISYLWEKMSGDDISISNTTVQTVTFSASGTDGQVKTATYKCTATDSDGPPNVNSDTVNIVFVFEAGA